MTALTNARINPALFEGAPPGWFDDDWELPEAPEIPEIWLPAWQAWERLNEDRPYRGGGMGAPVPGRIPWRDINDWCARKGGDPDEYDVIFREMDRVFIDWYQAQVRLEAEAAKARASRQR